MIYMTPAVALATNPTDANNPWIGYDSIVTVFNVSATDATDGFPATNIGNTSTAEFWRAANATGDKAVQVQDATAHECDYFAIAKHNLGSSAASLKLQGSADGSAWEDVTEDIFPATDFAIMFRFDPATWAYWRVLVTPGTATPQMAVLYIGKLLVAERRIYVGHTPLVLGRNQVVATGKSDNGQFLGRILRREFLKSNVKFENLTPGWYRTKFDPFAEASAQVPFFWAWRPGDYPEEVGYAWVQGGITPANSKANGMMSVEFDMEGVR